MCTTLQVSETHPLFASPSGKPLESCLATATTSHKICQWMWRRGCNQEDRAAGWGQACHQILSTKPSVCVALFQKCHSVSIADCLSQYFWATGPQKSHLRSTGEPPLPKSAMQMRLRFRRQSVSTTLSRIGHRDVHVSAT